MTEHETLADRVRFTRADWSWTQDELASASGVGVATIRRIEGGAYEPNLGTIRKLAAALHVRPGGLAFGGEPLIGLADMTAREQIREQTGPGSDGLPGFVVMSGGVWQHDGTRWRVVRDEDASAWE